MEKMRNDLSELEALIAAAEKIEYGNIFEAEEIIREQYPFKAVAKAERKYTPKEMMVQFLKDGFIDRYSGDKLIHPGMLRVMSQLLSPEVFPYHPHWKMEKCHPAYWEFCPTIDHKVPVAKSEKDQGEDAVKDTPENWVTASMITNLSKNAFTLTELGWSLHDPGDLSDWDGMTRRFRSIVKKDSGLLEVALIKKWYLATEAAIKELGLQNLFAL